MFYLNFNSKELDKLVYYTTKEGFPSLAIVIWHLEIGKAKKKLVLFWSGQI